MSNAPRKRHVLRAWHCPLVRTSLHPSLCSDPFLRLFFLSLQHHYALCTPPSLPRRTSRKDSSPSASFPSCGRRRCRQQEARSYRRMKRRKRRRSSAEAHVVIAVVVGVASTRDTLKRNVHEKTDGHSAIGSDRGLGQRDSPARSSKGGGEAFFLHSGTPVRHRPSRDLLLTQGYTEIPHAHPPTPSRPDTDPPGMKIQVYTYTRPTA